MTQPQRQLTIIDANTVQPESMPRELRALVAGDRTWVFGSPQHLPAWRQIKSMGRISVCKPANRTQGATMIAAAMCAGQEAKVPENRGARWLIISRNVGFRAIADQLHSQGSEAHWLPRVTEPALDAVLGGPNARLQHALVSLFHELNRGGKRVHMGTFGSQATERFREMSSKADREKLFGTSRYEEIVESLGLRYDGHWISEIGQPMRQAG